MSQIARGDVVVVTKGREKGKRGKVLKTFPARSRIIVEKVNFMKRHTKPTQKNPQGGIIEKEGTIHISNVALYDDKKTTNGGGTRTKTVKDGEQKVRIAVKSGTKFPSAGTTSSSYETCNLGFMICPPGF